MGHHPPPPRPRGEEGILPRKIRREDLEPLRQGGDWRPTRVLEAFGPALRPREQLAHLIVGCALLQGVHRVLELTERLIALVGAQGPRVKQMAQDVGLQPRRPVLGELAKQLASARLELVQTRARAANDVDAEPLTPDGLRLLDLHILASQTGAVIRAHEVVRRRNLTGVDYGLAVASRPPDLAYAETWIERLLGSRQMGAILLFVPPRYGRVLVVYQDGRLAYDPGAAAPEGARPG